MKKQQTYIFKGSTVEEKRNLVFANLELNSEKLDYSLRPPFNSFVNLSENVEWWSQGVSNPRPLGCQPSTLPTEL